jgi:DNA-binding XRE family transcriptional regulator
MISNREFYSLNLWLRENERSQSWLARRLQVHKVTISQWKKNNKVPHTMKLAICQVTGTTYEQLWEEL